MGIMYANVDSLCCRLSSRADKSGRFVTEHAANTERIKASAHVGSRGRQFAGDARRRSSKLICRCDREDNFLSSRVVTAAEGGGGGGTRPYLLRHAGPARLPSGETQETAKKNGPRKWPEGVVLDVDGAAGRKSLINKNHACHGGKRSREIWVISRENGGVSDPAAAELDLPNTRRGEGGRGGEEEEEMKQKLGEMAIGADTGGRGGECCRGERFIGGDGARGTSEDERRGR